jgi:putative addiction module component (TIGR02574 family)
MLDYEAVLADAGRLPVVDRIQLIEALWVTVPPESLPPLSEQWIVEIRRRSAEYDSGAAQGAPWEQVKAEALRRAGIPVPDASN